MSSSSQIERSSSQTRMLPTRPSFCDPGERRSGNWHACKCGRRSSGGGNLVEPAQAHHETGTLANFRTRPHLALVRLHDLVDNGEAKAGSTFKVRLEGLEDFFRLLGIDARTRVGKAHFPLPATIGESDGQASASICSRAGHSTHRVFGEVPEHLLELVAI